MYENALKSILCVVWMHFKLNQMPISCFLQLCLVSILGFILYCINYQPDEQSSLQFIVKVSLQTTCI